MKLRSIAIIFLIIILGVVIYFGIKNNNNGIEILSKTSAEDIKLELLQIRAKAKVIKEQSVVNGDENLLKGEKVKDSENEEVVNIATKLKDDGIISEEEEHFDKYYIWNKGILEELELETNLQKNNNVLVNYETLEIVFPEGLQFEKGGEKIYKYSEICD